MLAVRAFLRLCIPVVIFASGSTCSILPDMTAVTGNQHSSRTIPVIEGNEDIPAGGLSRPPGEQPGLGSDRRSFSDRYMRSLTAACPPPLTRGNRVTLLVDGDTTFVAMLRAIESARRHINLETYIINDDEVGRIFADSLLKKRAEGVEVNVMYDPIGSRNNSKSFFDRLRQGGVNVVKYNPPSFIPVLGKKGPAFRRTHRKMLIVDGATAFVGGINIGNAYMRRTQLPGLRRPARVAEYWRDTDAMIEGPAAADFQRLFLASWAEQDGTPLLREDYFPEVEQKGDQVVQAVASWPGPMNRLTYMMYVAAIAQARKSVFLTQGYFVPDNQLLDALADAARRGVDVRVILPRISDHSPVQQAGRFHYAKLLGAGVRIYERLGTILHAKTAVIDGIWSTIGSTNLELWSLVSTDEANAVIIDRQFASEMESLFWDDVDESEEILWEDWKERSLADRTIQFFFNLFHYWL